MTQLSTETIYVLSSILRWDELRSFREKGLYVDNFMQEIFYFMSSFFLIGCLCFDSFFKIILDLCIYILKFGVKLLNKCFDFSRSLFDYL